MARPKEAKESKDKKKLENVAYHGRQNDYRSPHSTTVSLQ